MSKHSQEKTEQKYELAVRLTCNTRPKSKALKRTRFAISMIGVLTVATNGATVFSELDHIKERDSSRYLRTIQHDGRHSCIRKNPRGTPSEPNYGPETSRGE